MISLQLCFSFLVHFPNNLCVLDHRPLLRLLNGHTRQDLDLLWLKVWRQVLEKRKSGACFHTTCHCVTIMSHFDPFPFLSCHNHGHWSAHRKCLWIGKVLWEYRKSFKRCHSNRPACLTFSTNIAHSFKTPLHLRFIGWLQILEYHFKPCNWAKRAFFWISSAQVQQCGIDRYRTSGWKTDVAL